MAYIQTKKQLNGDAGPPPPTGPTVLPGSPAAPPTSAAPPSSAAAAPQAQVGKTSEGGQLGLINSFMSANANQAGALGNKLVAGTVNPQIQNAQTQQSSAASAGYGLNPWGTAAGGASVNDPSGVHAAAAAANQTAGQKADVAAGQAAYGNAAAATDRAANAVGALNSNEGRQALLQQQYGNRGQAYGQGASALDSYLLGGQGGQAAFKDTQNQYGALRGQLSSAYGQYNTGLRNSFGAPAQQGPSVAPAGAPTVGSTSTSPNNPNGPGLGHGGTQGGSTNPPPPIPNDEPYIPPDGTDLTAPPKMPMPVTSENAPSLRKTLMPRRFAAGGL